MGVTRARGTSHLRDGGFGVPHGSRRQLMYFNKTFSLSVNDTAAGVTIHPCALPAIVRHWLLAADVAVIGAVDA